MWVKTFDGKNLINARSFHVSRNIGGKSGEKYAIQALSSAAGMQGGYVCGFYPDEERADAELEKIIAAIEAGEKVYRFAK